MALTLYITELSILQKWCISNPWKPEATQLTTPMLTPSPSCEEYCNTVRLGELFHSVKHCYLLPLLLPILPVTDRPTTVDSLDSHHEDSHDEKTLIVKIWFVSCTVQVCLSYPPPSCWYSLGRQEPQLIFPVLCPHGTGSPVLVGWVYFSIRLSPGHRLPPVWSKRSQNAPRLCPS